MSSLDKGLVAGFVVMLVGCFFLARGLVMFEQDWLDAKYELIEYKKKCWILDIQDDA